MREIELRLALVFYGGVSLAIYMHGVSREVLSLVRASACHTPTGRRSSDPDKCRVLSPSEKAYARFLAAVGEHIQIRVVVDAIAGASAGGVNGIMLARALAHDLPLDGHRDLWLKHADVTELARPQDGLTRYLKSGVSPVLDRLISSQLNKEVSEPETREKLRLFMQSRWFTPPFSGEAYIGWMLDACKKMEEGTTPGSTLIPHGQTLDLFVTITDYHGNCRQIRIDDPAFIEEWDHRRILNFKARHRASGELESELDSLSAPELVFAARATSSFPGAFPPATVKEMDKVLSERGDDWTNRERFLTQSLQVDGDTGEHRCFVDGSVVMNKPFAPVIDVVRQRPAAREVARRLVYIDPTPVEERGLTGPQEEVPGFFRVILASLAHIPRNEPIGDDLLEIEEGNRRSRWVSRTIAAADPVVSANVRKVLPFWGSMTTETVTRCREKANEAAHDQAGFAILNYQALKLHAIADKLGELAKNLAGVERGGPADQELANLLVARIERLTAMPSGSTVKSSLDVIRFLKQYDVHYRIRRLRFSIRRLNGFYLEPAATEEDSAIKAEFDRLKSQFYKQIDLLQERWQTSAFDGNAKDAARDLLTHCQTGDQLEQERGLDRFLDAIAGQMQLMDLDISQDELLSEAATRLQKGVWYERLIEAYVGFAYYDLVIYPGLQSDDFAEAGETLVDRISPKDATGLQDEGFELKGKALNTFGAFFNRSWREHDYVWGRLNTAERLISIIMSASDEIRIEPGRFIELKTDIFNAILEEERPFLAEIPDDLDKIQDRITTMANKWKG
ncbi:patatin [Roseibium sp. TrichSKD4]|uniref:patatin-like protein n=1 Tax=Roseibium sp. TrichSKD4 TaxID=744980 RepID=UPI0001E573BF|nr:patatin-like protein [Roseibium sp. TrichSKD4]EFO29207.1 patatin [Roseibium sp. TrichSKD4]